MVLEKPPKLNEEFLSSFESRIVVEEQIVALSMSLIPYVRRLNLVDTVTLVIQPPLTVEALFYIRRKLGTL